MKEAPGTRDYDWWLLAILATICTLGVIEIYSATHGSTLAGMHMKQVRWLAIGFVAMFALSRIDYHLILDQAPILYLVGVSALAGAIATTAPLSGQSDSEAAPIYGIKLPQGYRDWRLISVKQLVGNGGKLKQLRAQLGNDIAIAAMREGKLPFPDGAMIAALHWNEVSSDADNQVLATGFPNAGLESSFAGSAVNVQFMIKDSKKYAASGGWGYADFVNGKPNTEAVHEKCFPCHQPAKDRDYVFTHYAPTP